MRTTGFTLIVLIVLIVLVAACERQAGYIIPGNEGLAYAAAQAQEDVDCGLLRERAHEDPVVLARQFVARDAAGEFTRFSPWLAGAALCPGHIPGYDVVTVIERYQVEPLHVDVDTALVAVHYERLGELVPAGDMTMRFERRARLGIDTLPLVLTTWGWRIVGPPRNWQVAADALPELWPGLDFGVRDDPDRGGGGGS
jgi:hypothetical protein